MFDLFLLKCNDVTDFNSKKAKCWDFILFKEGESNKCIMFTLKVFSLRERSLIL